ncbi:doublecortin domain-containing protein 2 isoform X2 [Tachyglossus aculeatus]|uniref:doublecortin domain-containing protein 2 isoform X2 n=1 Tax=Tachyglossus aculeatus TaxID=9261 RepID=UPI0018F668F5|nr:doublecortin domain-containing protein 2 isoform X2 [Tachyglossus aculeatus]
MSGTRPNCLSQPVVKNVLVYRNGDPFFAGRRLVIHEKKVSSFDVFLKEVTGGVQAPFGAVRNIYTPRAGHRIRKLEQLQSGEQYVAGGREAFKKLNYLDIGETKKKLHGDSANAEVKPVVHSRINVSARFRKPLQEPCTIFLIANGDLINPAVRLFIPRKALNKWDLVLEMVTEKVALRSGAAHRLYTLEGKIVQSGSELENGQFYVAVGRDKFKKLPYSELLFDKSTVRRPFGQKASSLPPIVGSRKSKGSGKDRHSKSTVESSDGSSPQPPKSKGRKNGPGTDRPLKTKQRAPQESAADLPDGDEGIFKAGAERSEMNGAVEIQEDEDTLVEVPLDQRPAEMVDEEEEDNGRPEGEVAEGSKEDHSGMNGEVEEKVNGDAHDADEGEAGPEEEGLGPKEEGVEPNEEETGLEEGKENPDQEEENPDQEEDNPDQGEDNPDQGEDNLPHINGTNEENGEELERTTEDKHHADEEDETKSAGDGGGQDKDDLDPARPPRPEVKITSPQESDHNEAGKERAAVA